MSLPESFGLERQPSRAVSIALSVALVAVWGTIRLYVFPTMAFPLTYVIPMLLCVWTRDRVALVGMTLAFFVLHHIKLFWILPAGELNADEWWGNYVATLLNISVGAVVIHQIIRLRDRLDAAMNNVRDQAEELRMQTEELAQQNEELAVQGEELSQQTEELTQQSEEFASQNEELQSQADEIRTLNASLERRETLLQTLLETARISGTEGAVLQHTVIAALDLFRTIPCGVAVFERNVSNQLRCLASAPYAIDGEASGVTDHFVQLVLAQNRTAGIDDLSLRPDLTTASMADNFQFHAVMATPIRFGGEPSAALAIYSTIAHEWTDEEFHLAEWLADQCGRVLQALRVQSDLREADRRKSEFLATLSHELRNPLAPIGFALKLLESGNGDYDNHLPVIKRQVQQLVRLVDDLLDATRLTSNRIQIRTLRADLVPVVRHAVEAARPDVESAGHSLVTIFPAHPVWLDIDADRMAQVVTNLLNNAARYTPPGGTVTVSISEDGHQSVLSISDTGIGLDPGDRDRIFEMFTQVGEPGSGGLGIGLALVRGIVELHGGHVEAHSKGRGHGSEFSIALPVQEAPLSLERSVESEAAAIIGVYRVLVVDDNRDSAEMMSLLLSMHGHTVRTAHDAESALKVAFAFAPQAALLDIGLPGINGYELARRLRDDHRTRGIRLVAVTGWGQDADRARARAAGFDAHLTKPAEPDRILAALGDAERV